MLNWINKTVWSDGNIFLNLETNLHEMYSSNYDVPSQFSLRKISDVICVMSIYVDLTVYIICDINIISYTSGLTNTN